MKVNRKLLIESLQARIKLGEDQNKKLAEFEEKRKAFVEECRQRVLKNDLPRDVDAEIQNPYYGGRGRQEVVVLIAFPIPDELNNRKRPHGAKYNIDRLRGLVTELEIMADDVINISSSSPYLTCLR